MRPSLIAMLAAAGLAWTAGASAQPGPDAATAQAPATTASVAPGVAPAPLPPVSLPPNPTLASTAGTVIGAQSANGPLSGASVSGAPVSGTQATKPAKKRLGWEQRFTQANTTNDGRLTLEQAKAGYTTVARHFKEIDLDGKGWVTTDDIRAWHKARRAARSAPKAAAGTSTGTSTGEALRPQPAFHRSYPNAQQGTTADPVPNPVDGRKPEDPS